VKNRFDIAPGRYAIYEMTCYLRFKNGVLQQREQWAVYQDEKLVLQWGNWLDVFDATGEDE
jgi:hypothetical protein